MMRRIVLLACLFALTVGQACQDVISPPATPGEVVELPVSTTTTLNVSEEFERPVSILRYWTDAGFDVSQAYAQAFMRFFANRAETQVELSVRDGSSIVATRSGRTTDGWLLPAVREMWATTTAGVGSSCGHVADGSAFFHAWHEAQSPVGRVKWSDQHRSASDSEVQPSCSGSCADQVIVDPDESCDEDGGDSGGDEPSGPKPSDELNCHKEYVVILVDDRVIYEGVATVCE